jgi:hypothetical protein
MKQVLVITGLLCLVLLSQPSLTQGAKEKDARRDKLLAARDAWDVAFYAGDTDAMDKVEAKEFVVIGERAGQTRMLTKEEQLKGIKKAVKDKKWFPKGMTRGTEAPARILCASPGGSLRRAWTGRFGDGYQHDSIR